MMESSQHGVDRLRALEYQQLLHDAAQQRLAAGIQSRTPAGLRWMRRALGGVIAWLPRQALPLHALQRTSPVPGG